MHSYIQHASCVVAFHLIRNTLTFSERDDWTSASINVIHNCKAMTPEFRHFGFDSLLKRIPGSIILAFSTSTKVHKQKKHNQHLLYSHLMYLTTIIQYSNDNRIYTNIGFHVTYNVMIKNAKFNIFPSAVRAQPYDILERINVSIQIF